MPTSPGRANDALVLTSGDHLLHDLTHDKWGRPLALGAVVVGSNGTIMVDSSVDEELTVPLRAERGREDKETSPAAKVSFFER
jgi:hypothetical protein